LKEACQNESYALNNCSTLPGSSGSIILDCYGRLAGIHIGINNSRKQKNNDIFFTKETYNKYLPINSNQFQAFIGETILSNIKDDEAKKTWLFLSK
jgi:V8-like Glu-specific endopeptidase